MDVIMKTLSEKLEQLSNLARETSGAAFVIQHVKENGKWKVTFNNLLLSKKNKPKETDFKSAIDAAIQFILENRKIHDKPEIFTLYKN
jgi:hypothetical protein